MVYSFIEDLNNLRDNYESYSTQLKSEGILDSSGNANVSPELFATQYTDETPYKGEAPEYDSDEYVNEGVGSKGYKKTKKAMDKATAYTDTESPKGEGLTANSAMGIAQFGMNAANSLSNVASSEKESWQNAGSLAIQGASAGAQVGGPWGAAIGGAIGLGVGVVDALGDTSKRNSISREKVNKESEGLKTQREIQYAMDTKSKDIDKMMKLRKAQLNYIDLNY